MAYLLCMLSTRLLHRTARTLKRRGFTLVELLVVIGLIAILAGVALGPITRGIKQAKQSGGMQTSRTIAVAEFAFSNDNNGNYPDTKNPASNSSTGAAAIAFPLIQGGYTSDPSIYFISGSGGGKFSGTGTISSSNISFDFLGGGGNGINSNYPDQVPIVWSGAGGGTEPNITASAGQPITSAPTVNAPFGQDGMAVCFKSNSAKFVTYDKTGSACTLVDTSWAGGTPASAAVLSSGN
jgi:prepilin-type N-terminal cleavage/methylation domain-containing protein